MHFELVCPVFFKAGLVCRAELDDGVVSHVVGYLLEPRMFSHGLGVLGEQSIAKLLLDHPALFGVDQVHAPIPGPPRGPQPFLEHLHLGLRKLKG